jgi:cardiolipin synthase
MLIVHWQTVLLLVFLSRIAVAVLVTVHVLLNKKDVGAAIGWIGITILMPFTGGTLYAMFGINRVHRRARKLIGRASWHSRTLSSRWKRAEEGSFAPLAHMVGKLTGRPLMGGNHVEMLHNGDEVYPQMLAAIEGATSSVLLCSYIFRGDAAGARFLAALIGAHRRGVAVRVLVDGIGSGYFRCPRRGGAAPGGCRWRASCIRCCRGACPSSTCATTRRSWWWMGIWASWAG